MRTVKKAVRRLLAAVAIALGLIVLIGSIGIILLRAEPEFYQLPKLTIEEFEAAAQRAVNKLAMIQNEAARIRVEQNPSRGQSRPTTAPAESRRITVSFTQHELNAFFEKWSNFNNWKSSYERYITEPAIILEDGRIIFAARMKEVDAIASLHFEPRIDRDGKFELELERVLAGRLPLPEAVMNRYRQRLVGGLTRHLPSWRHGATLDRRGMLNTNAILATMGSMLINIVDHEPADPIVFLPLVERGAVAVKLTEVRIENHTLTMTVEPLSAAERAELLRHIKEPSASAR